MLFFTTKVHLMREIIQQQFKKSTQKNTLISDLIYGIIDSRKTSSTMLSMYVSGDSKRASKIRRIERFWQKGIGDEYALCDVIDNLLKKRKVQISLDRTNWKNGKDHINALVAYASDGFSGSILDIKMLDNNGGNSSSIDRINMGMEVLQRYDRGMIECVLGDREFFSIEFANWLIENNIAFSIRLRENLEFVQEYLKKGTTKGVTIKNVVIGWFKGKIMTCDLSIKILKDEYLILASYKIESPLEEYKKRWVIERFFKMLKTGGFNIEDTKMKDLDRLKILFQLCAIAYLICTIIGKYRSTNVDKIRWKKKDKCYEYSYFRWGLDWIQMLILQGVEKMMHALAAILPSLQL